MKKISLITVGTLGIVASACVAEVRTGPAQPTNAQAAPPPAPAPAQPAPVTAGVPVVGTPAAPAAPVVGVTATPAPMEEIAEPPATDKPAELKWNFADGRPQGLRSGAPMGIWIWQDKNGTEWHLRTTTAGQQHRFQGRVVGEKTPLAQVDMVAAEHKDRLRMTPKHHAVFDFTTKGGEDGMDFKVAGNQCVRFHVKVDGQPAPREIIHIGAASQHPIGGHFKLCP